MGMKEESLPIRYLFGYAGQFRPLQVVGGKCPVCNEPVWIDCKPTKKKYRETIVVHYGCENRKEHRS